MDISGAYLNIKTQLPKDVTLVAISKTKPISDIQQLYDCGQRVFGENKVQEMVAKFEQLPKDIDWHLIGHLQRNKVKYIAPFVALIHGVDSLKLLKEIDKQGKLQQRLIPCLLQVYIASEETKFGLLPDEVWSLLRSEEFKQMSHIKIDGLMGLASNADDEQLVAKEFSSLKALFDEIATHNFPHCNMRILSMGMSGDYQIAIGCGSNMLRLGSLLFGSRS